VKIGRKRCSLTIEACHLAAILFQAPGQNLQSVVVQLLIIGVHAVPVHDKQVLLEGVTDFGLELATLDGGHEVDLARGQSPQHDARDGQVDGAPDVTLAVLDRAAAVEQDEASAVRAQLSHQPFAVHALLRRCLLLLGHGLTVRRHFVLFSDHLHAVRAATRLGHWLTASACWTLHS